MVAVCVAFLWPHFAVCPSALLLDPLATWFKECYRQGAPFDLEGYQKDGDEYLHWATGIRIWKDFIDVSQGAQEVVVLFHYTGELAYRNITEPSKTKAEIWASLKALFAHYGQGVYGSSKDPAQFGSLEAILENNYRPQRALFRQGEAGLPDPARAAQLVEENRRFVDPNSCRWCIAVMAARDTVYDVHKRATPEMVHGPGRNIHGKELDKDRDIWVARVVGDEGAVEAAAGKLVATLRERVRALEAGLGPDHEDTLGEKFRLGTILDARGSYGEAEIECAAGGASWL